MTRLVTVPRSLSIFTKNFHVQSNIVSQTKIWLILIKLISTIFKKQERPNGEFFLLTFIQGLWKLFVSRHKIFYISRFMHTQNTFSKIGKFQIFIKFLVPKLFFQRLNLSKIRRFNQLYGPLLFELIKRKNKTKVLLI